MEGPPGRVGITGTCELTTIAALGAALVGVPVPPAAIPAQVSGVLPPPSRPCRRSPLMPKAHYHLLALLGAGLVGCARAPTYMRPAGAPGDAQATLGWWLTAVAALVMLLVAIIVLVGSLRRGGPGRGSRAGGATGLSWIYVGVALTVAVLLATFIGTMVTLAQAARVPRGATLTLDVTGHQWWWEVRYRDSLPAHDFVTANEIHVPVGRPVRLRVRTEDVIHSFWVPELAGKIDLIPGQTNESWLRADRPGRFRGTCGEYCGLQHAQMALYVVADEPARFEAWAANERRAVVPAPGDTAARRGERVFVASCGSCHTIRGSGAHGRYGPDLTHLASRRTIAAGTLPNTPGNLAGWITNTQGVKPGARMPPVPLAPADLQAVLAYLGRAR